MNNKEEQPTLPPWRAKKHSLAQYRRLLGEIKEERLRLGSLAARLAAADPAERRMSARELSEMAGYTARVADNLANASRMARELQQFINEIDDSLLRRLFTMRYVRGYTWKKIAFHLHYADESAVRKMHDRYLRRIAAEEAALPRRICLC